MLTELATKVLLLGASSSPKKKGVVAPTPLAAETPLPDEVGPGIFYYHRYVTGGMNTTCLAENN